MLQYYPNKQFQAPEKNSHLTLYYFYNSYKKTGLIAASAAASLPSNSEYNDNYLIQIEYI